MKKAVLILFILFMIYPQPARAGNIQMAHSSLPVDPFVAKSVEQALITDIKYLPENIEYYAITYVEQQGDNFSVSVVGLKNVKDPDNWNLSDNGSWLGEVVLQKSYPAYTGVTSKNPLFTTIKKDAIPVQRKPGPVVKPESEPTEINGPVLNSVPANSIFPWQSGKDSVYGPSGVHNCGFSLTGWSAVDFVAGTVAGGNTANDSVFNSNDGHIEYMCKDSHQVALQMCHQDSLEVCNVTDGILYDHVIDNPYLVRGATFYRGVTLGTLIHGTISDYCGHTQQQAGNYHVHFCFVDNGSIDLEGWTLNTASGEWSKTGESNKGPGSLFTAEWTFGEGEPGDGNPGMQPGGNLWDYIVGGFVSFVTMIISKYFLPHQALGLAYTVVRYVSVPIRLVFVLGVLKFGFVFILGMTMLTLELARSFYSLYMWIKRVIPFAG